MKIKRDFKYAFFELVIIVKTFGQNMNLWILLRSISSLTRSL